MAARIRMRPRQRGHSRTSMAHTRPTLDASGTADECRAKVQEYIDAGCTCPVLYPLGDDVRAMIDAFGV